MGQKVERTFLAAQAQLTPGRPGKLRTRSFRSGIEGVDTTLLGKTSLDVKYMA